MSHIICQSKGLGRLRLKKTEDSDRGIMWVSDPINYGDWPFCYVLRLQYTEDHDQEWAETNGRFHMEVHVASPVAAKKELVRIAENMGMTLKEFKEGPMESQCMELVNEGISACLYQCTGNNMRKTIRQAKSKVPEIDFMFGFWMDKPVNAIGDTGWDWVKGDIGAASRRRKKKV